MYDTLAVGAFLIGFSTFFLLMSAISKSPMKDNFLVKTKEVEKGHTHLWMSATVPDPKTLEMREKTTLCTDCGYIPDYDSYLTDERLKSYNDSVKIRQLCIDTKQKRINELAQQLGLDDRIIEKIFDSGEAYSRKATIARFTMTPDEARVELEKKDDYEQG